MPVSNVPNVRVDQLLDGDSTPQQEVRAITQQLIDTAGATYEATLTPAQILTLNATPVPVLDAPDPGQAWQIIRVTAYKPAGVAYDGIATTEDLTLKYTNAAGAILAQVETTGFLDQANAQTRIVGAVTTDLTPVAQGAIVAHMLAGEITTGDQPIKLRITARLIATVW